MAGYPEIHSINFHWLLRLRWGAIAGQTAVILAVQLIMGIALPLLPLFAVVLCSGLVNLAAARFGQTYASERGGERLLGGLLALDILVLTALLYLTGGPFNPFSFLYLVHITLSAVILPVRWTWSLAGMSLLCSAGLFLDHKVLELGGEHHQGGEHVSLHLQGMWVAFGVAAVFIVYFVHRIKTALDAQQTKLEEAKRLTVKNERLASLATLAAGAAHELATPLSTIAVVAKELERALEKSGAGEGPISDALLIRREVHRCRKILDHMAAEAGETAGEHLSAVGLDDLIDDALDGLPQGFRIEVEVEADAQTAKVYVPRTAMAQVLRGVLKNAIEASPEDTQVGLRASRSQGDRCVIEVQDHGHGMAPEVLERAGEPFFTTKEPGMGMGLGLFLTRALLERLGGKLELESTKSAGTTARLVLPSMVPKAVRQTAASLALDQSA